MCIGGGNPLDDKTLYQHHNPGKKLTTPASEFWIHPKMSTNIILCMSWAANHRYEFISVIAISYSGNTVTHMYSPNLWLWYSSYPLFHNGPRHLVGRGNKVANYDHIINFLLISVNVATKGSHLLTSIPLKIVLLKVFKFNFNGLLFCMLLSF